MVKVGIDKINFYIPQYYISIIDLALARGIDPDKFTKGIGQDEMAVIPNYEDIITMAVNAAKEIIDEDDRDKIDMILFATESSFDYSKAAATYLHELLNLYPYVRSIELKEACYSGTAALQIATDYVKVHPERKVLIVTSDIARYGLNTPGEVTQGAGSIAMLVSANPKIMVINQETVFMTDNQYDFWRPSYSDVALVDGKFSNQMYMDMFCQTITEFLDRYPSIINQINFMLFHLPYSKMGKKALNQLSEMEKIDPSVIDKWLINYEASIQLGKKVGNIYTGSLYLGLISLLMFSDSLSSSELIGLFSYGSGSVAEFFTGQLVEDFKSNINTKKINTMFDNRIKLSIEEYEQIFNGSQNFNAKNNNYEICKIKEISDHKRFYEFN